MFKILLTLFILTFGTFTPVDDLHDFHLSNSELQYKSSNDELQLSIKVFIDDLESALAARGVEGLYIGTEKETEDSAIHISDYMNDVFQITAEKEILQSVFIGKELSEDLAALWCYIKFPLENGCNEINVKNSLLTEMFDDQKNIVSFKTESGKRDFFTFDLADKENVFSCE